MEYEGARVLFHPDAGFARPTSSRYSPTSNVQYFLPDGDVAEARP